MALNGRSVETQIIKLAHLVEHYAEVTSITASHLSLYLSESSPMTYGKEYIAARSLAHVQVVPCRTLLPTPSSEAEVDMMPNVVALFDSDSGLEVKLPQVAVAVGDLVRKAATNAAHV